MGMKSYIFLSCEGYTYEPIGNDNETPKEIENMQVIGFAKGKSAENAFKNLIQENQYLLSTNFRNIFSYSLEYDDYQNYRCLHTIEKVDNKQQ